MITTTIINVASETKTYFVGTNYYSWIIPAMEIVGIIFQIASIFLKKIYLLLCGLILVILFTFMESDITLLIGDLLASVGILIFIIKSKNQLHQENKRTFNSL